MHPHDPSTDRPLARPRTASRLVGFFMILGWMFFVVLLIAGLGQLGRHDRARGDARVRCERSSPPWATADCPQSP